MQDSEQKISHVLKKRYASSWASFSSPPPVTFLAISDLAPSSSLQLYDYRCDLYFLYPLFRQSRRFSSDLNHSSVTNTRESSINIESILYWTIIQDANSSESLIPSIETQIQNLYLSFRWRHFALKKHNQNTKVEQDLLS